MSAGEPASYLTLAEGTAVLSADGWPVELATWLPHSSTLQSAQEQQGRT